MAELMKALLDDLEAHRIAAQADCAAAGDRHDADGATCAGAREYAFADAIAIVKRHEEPRPTAEALKDRVAYQETKARVRRALANSSYGSERDAIRGALDAVAEWITTGED